MLGREQITLLFFFFLTQLSQENVLLKHLIYSFNHRQGVLRAG